MKITFQILKTAIWSKDYGRFIVGILTSDEHILALELSKTGFQKLPTMMVFGAWALSPLIENGTLAPMCAKEKYNGSQHNV